MRLGYIVFLLTSLNLLNWLDRGLIAGAGTLIKGCVEKVEDCGNVPKVSMCDDDDDDNSRINTCSSRCMVCGDYCEDSGKFVEQTGFGMNNFGLGLVQSSFMIGYMVGSFVFSKASHGTKVYRILGIGMSIWTVSALICGLSGLVSDKSHSRYILILGRILSGTGEAALATIALPHLDDILEEKTKGRYLSIYLTAMPVGNALGFVFAGVISERLSWEWMFLLEAMVAPIFIFIFFTNPELQHYVIKTEETIEVNTIPLIQDEETTITNETTSTSTNTHVNLYQEIVTCLRSVVFVFSAFGLAMYTFTTAGLAFYMPLFLQNYRPCDLSWMFTETQADEAFGLMVLPAGLFGVLVGGLFLDAVVTDTPVSHALRVSIVQLFCATIMLALAMVTTNVYLFFIFAFVGCLFAFSTTAPINRALLGSVPIRTRPIAMAWSIVIAHFFGDVPSPIIIGAVADARSSQMALVVAWFGLLVGCFFWLAALYYAIKKKM